MAGANRRGGIDVPGATRRSEDGFQEDDMATHRFIDVQHHFYPPKMLAERREALVAFSPGFANIVNWTPATSIEEMDLTGTSAALISMGPPGVWLGNLEQSHRLTTIMNDFGAEMVRDNPSRFGLLATLPLPDIDFSLRHIEYVFDDLGADGIGLMSNYDSKWLGHAHFLPVWEELNRRKATIFVHPTSSNHFEGLLPEPSVPVMEFVFDTTRTIVNLLYSGVLARFPDIRWIFAHGGGTIPFLADRIALWQGAMKNDESLQKRVPNGVAYELQRLYFDVASVTNVPAMAALKAFVPTEQMMFGSDMPFLPISRGQEELEALKSMLDEADMANIAHRTAERLFPRLKV